MTVADPEFINGGQGRGAAGAEGVGGWGVGCGKGVPSPLREGSEEGAMP